jgi:RNA polymerase sigma factor (sigma-70 family)
MATNQLRRVIQTLRGAALPCEEARLTDGQLLERYVRGREEAAFAALVRRHGPMVWGVCRRILGGHHDAEDAFQATFLVLVRKAASVVPRDLVANWLYGVARQTALKARTTAARRRAREKQVTAMPEPAFERQDLWDGLRPLLDQELGRLPDKYRALIVLCDLEGKTRKEAARHCRLPEGTVASRLAAARALLARRLARSGLAVSGAALAAVLSQQAASAGVPASVASSTIKAASLFAAGQAAVPGLLSGEAVDLAEGVLKTMLLTKLKTATAVLLAVAVLGAAAAAFPRQGPADPPGKEVKETAVRLVKEKKGGENGAVVVSGFLKAVDAEKSTLTVAGKEGEKTFTAANDAAVVNNGRPGTLAELPVRAFVTLSLLADQKTARAIEAVGPNTGGSLKAVDAEKRTLTFDDRGLERTFTVTKNASVQIDGRPGKLAELPPGAVVSLSWFVDQKTARTVQAEGRSFQVVLVKAVDADKGTITFEDERQPPEVAGKTFPVAKDAFVQIDGKPGKLAGVPPGAFVNLYLSADQKTVRNLAAEGRQFQGVLVKAVDADKGTITFEDERQPPEVAGKTFPVAKDAFVQIDGKPGKLAGVPPGASVRLNLSVDQKTVRNLAAEGRQFQRVPVKAVDADKGTITFEDERQPEEVAGKTFPVAKGAFILIDGKPGKLGAVPRGASVSLTLSVDQKTVRSLQAGGSLFFGVVVKAVDADKGTITFDDDRQPEEVAGKTFPVAKGASILIDGKPGKLAGVPRGAFANWLTLSADQKTVCGFQAAGAQVGGFGQSSAVVTAVDAEKSTITIDVNGEGEKTYPVAKDASVMLDGKPAKLAGLPREAPVALTLRVDQETVGWIEAKSP